MKHRLRSVKYFIGGLKPVSRGASLTFSSDVDQNTEMFGLHERPPNLSMHHLKK